MAFDEGLATRVREIFAGRVDIAERRMFGGLAFMLSGNMCCGIVNDTLMARVGTDRYAEALSDEHAREMDFTGRAMKGFVYISPEGIESEAALRAWIDRCVSFAGSLPAK